MNGLSLCAGVGGLELGLRLAVRGYRCVGYCERDAYAAAVIVARMEDAALDRAPIWDDLETFPGELYRGKVDIISAGFPCQPFSVAGTRKGTDDDRWIWWTIAGIIRDVRPRYVFLENVPGLLTHSGGFGTILGDLAEGGFDAEWDMFSAAGVGAPHLRKRVFILACRDDERGEGVAHCDSDSLWQQPGRLCGEGRAGAAEPRYAGEAMGDATGSMRTELPIRGDASFPKPFPPGPSDTGGWAAVGDPTLEPAVCFVADGIPSRVDALRAAGNAVVPVVAAVAFRTLASRVGRRDPRDRR